MPATPATDALKEMFAQFGLADLADQFAALISDPDLTEAQVMLKVYDLPAYKARFPAMDYLRKSGQTWSEADYFAQERAYAQVLRNNQMPAGFMDTPGDFAEWIKGSVAPDELNSRITQARRVVESSDPSMLDAAWRFYGLDKSTLIAYAADPAKAQGIVDKQMRLIETGAAAGRYGFEQDLSQAESLVNDPIAGSMSADQLRQQFSGARLLADQDTRLSGIEQTDYNEQDAVDAVLRDNQELQRQSARRLNREQSRFSGSNAGAGVFGRNPA